MWRYLICFLPTVAMAQVEQGEPNASFEPAFEGQTRAPELPASEIEVSVFASGFDFPWGIAPLPDGGFLVTERGGTLKRILPGGAVVEVAVLPEIEAIRQGGLLDVAVSPEFERDQYVYFTYSKAV